MSFGMSHLNKSMSCNYFNWTNKHKYGPWICSKLNPVSVADFSRCMNFSLNCSSNISSQEKVAYTDGVSVYDFVRYIKISVSICCYHEPLW